ncbi:MULTISPECIES: YwqG family protein [unclassified Lysinibacillus]|uniref:YwqG family protein n=1 Tax=unclassified Lysinibacillus TaxID=2636778 RepID=UPI0020128E3A|nr:MULTISPECIES: YwqG family protein [unclassified Lysinibacillus]MCL1698679.1 YwqG family protein [Lysinibacillus sp. BPa_S21]MCL1702020.1 YwqG family protein [Lysinibacillus sp. Bpr_S20]
MNKTTNLLLPKELESFRFDIEDSLRSAMIITPYTRSTTVTESKFAGEPYLPYYQTYPKDITGEPMRLLAQINFAEMPPLKDFPSQGMLQFFISSNIFVNADHYHEDIFQQFYKIRFYPTVNDEATMPKQEFLAQTVDDRFPIHQELALQFQPIQEPVSALDYRAVSYLPNLIPSTEDVDLLEIYLQHFLGAGAKIGGYPYFLEEDIRHESQLLKRYDVLLLQIDSNDEIGIMWADSGVGKFFINREKLLQRDFSDILFQWEHY